MNLEIEKEDTEVVSINGLTKRILSSIILILFTLLLNQLGGYYFLIIVLSIVFLLLLEYYRLFSLPLDIKFFLNYIGISLCIILTFYNFIFLTIFPFMLGITIASVKKGKWFIRVFSYFYFTIPACLIIFLNNYVENGKLMITWFLIIVWSSDIFGFTFGKIFKGPKLISIISPNKTWVGFLASIFGASILSILFSIYFNLTNYKDAFLIGLIVSVFCVIGDLFESFLKRKNNIKDTSKLIPGHGGVLDRLDGFLFAIVIFCIIAL